MSNLIRFKARQLARQRVIGEDEIDDIAQSLAVHLVRKLPLHDPKRASLDTFANRIAENWVRTFLEARRAEKRDPGKCPRSLEETLFDDGGDPLTLADTLDVDRGDLGDGPTFRGVERQRDLALDFERFRETLPPRERELFDRLQRMNLADAVRDMKGKRTTLNRVVDRLRRLMEESNLAPEFRNSVRHSATRPGK